MPSQKRVVSLKEVNISVNKKRDQKWDKKKSGGSW